METIKGFFVRPSPTEQNRKWQSTLRQQQRQLQRQMDDLKRSEKATEKQIKMLAKKGDTKDARLLAREIVAVRKQRQRLGSSQATIGSLGMQLNEQMATYKISGTLQKSTSIMKNVNGLVRLPELSGTMRNLSMELTRAGIMDEMVDDTLDTLDNGELDEEADETVENVLDEITGQRITAAPEAPAAAQKFNQAPQEEEDEGDLEEQLASMRGQIAKLQE